MEMPDWVVKMPYDLQLDEIKDWYTLKILEACQGNRTRTAERLGISLRGLRDKLNRLKAMGYEVMDNRRI